MMRAPVQGEERLRWVARAANEAASTLLLLEPEPAERTLRRLAAQYARILSLSPQDVDDALRKGRHYFIDLAHALELPQPYGVGVARLLRPAPVLSGMAPLHAAQEDDLLVSHALRTPQVPPPCPWWCAPVWTIRQRQRPWHKCWLRACKMWPMPWLGGPSASRCCA